MKPNISRVLLCVLGYLLMSMLPLVLRATQPTDLKLDKNQDKEL